MKTKTVYAQNKRFSFRCVSMPVWSQFEQFGFTLWLSGVELVVFRRPRVTKYRYDISSAPQKGPDVF